MISSFLMEMERRRWDFPLSEELARTIKLMKFIEILHDIYIENDNGGIIGKKGKGEKAKWHHQ